MSKRSFAVGLGVLVVLWMLVMPSSLYPCGPYFRVPVFVSSQPELVARYVNGEMGILRATYSRTNLFVAWRVLNGRPLSTTERQSLAPKPARVATESQRELSPIELWLKARGRVLPNPATYFSAERELKDYQFFTNCNDDAFVTAANALNARIERYGANDPAVKEWTVGQTTVFSNCRSGSEIPPVLPDSAPVQWRADRAYQIAAANFYATHYDEAAQRFTAIAEDAGSPWRKYGLFLSARAYIRKATIGPMLDKPEAADAEESLRQSQRILQQVVSDPALKEVHASARRLMSFVAYHLEPQKQSEVLGAKLQKPTNDEAFGQELIDYFRLTRDYRGKDDEMADWIEAVATGNVEESLRRWKQEPKSVSWLLAALMSARADSQDAPELVKAALRVPANSPAYLTAQYYSAKLRYGRAEYAAARGQIDGLLKANSAKMPHSALNAFTVLRAQSAADLTDFARFAVLQPVAIGWDEGSDYPDEAPCASDLQCPKKMVSVEAAEMLNHLPLPLLLGLAQDSRADFVLRRGSAIVAWERALLFGDFAIADAAARVIANLSKQDAADLSGYLQAKTTEEKKFAGALAMLKWPGATPFFNSDEIRDDPMRVIDNYRRNWWCSGSRLQQARANKPKKVNYPQFLNAAEHKRAEAELDRLDGVSGGPDYLASVVITWARGHVKDERVPEALHLAVRATRYGCTDAETVKYSKGAFELLHKNYPQSEWTKKTPYYFKD